MAWILFLLTFGALVFVYLGRRRDAKRAADAAANASREADRIKAELLARVDALLAENSSLQGFKDVRDAAAEAARLRADAQSALESAKERIEALRYAAKSEADAIRQKASSEAEELRRTAHAVSDEIRRKADALKFAAQSEADAVRAQAQADAEDLRREARASNTEAKRNAEALIGDANMRASRLISDAEVRAQEIAGDAYCALQDAQQLERTATAMRNVVEGYGDRYLKPTYGLLDQLASDYGFDEAGRELKQARANSQSMIEAQRAATCDYVERHRRETAIRFVLDAFNGKVDTILARVKSDNAGTLDQQIRDAFSLVNHNGGAFRDARITPEYVASRLEELRWAAVAMALKERDKDEQRRIREQIREEERARREIEKALRDAAKEEDALQKAMSKVQAQVARANAEQRAVFEAQLAELQSRLEEAEARNQRALSMAQQTKAGHIYVISNVGSFGEHVFKVGMTRRLDPFDRVRELGDASVPFPFDVHAMIWADDAPALENALHKRFVLTQVNKVNPRKEFFRVGVTGLRQMVEAMGLQATWTLAAEASQYRETLAIERELATQSAEAHQWLRTQLSVTPEELAPEAVEE